MRRRLLWTWILLAVSHCLAVSQSVSPEAAKWLAGELAESGFKGEGKLSWCFVFTTGHFGSDPVLAQESRDFALSLGHEVLAKEDRITVAALELDLWSVSPPQDLAQVVLDDLSASFPTTPAPQSKGGRDIELGLLKLVNQLGPQTVYLVISPGPSQLARDGSGSLLGAGSPELLEALTMSGYRQPVTNAILSSGRKLWLTALLPSNLQLEGGKRSKLAAPASANRQPITREKAESTTTQWVLPIVFAGLGIAAGYLIRSSKRGAVSELPHANSNDGRSSNEEHQLGFAEETTKASRRLDLVSQELEDSVHTLRQSSEVLQKDLIDNAKLRSLIIERDSQLESWEDTAIDFLDAAHRAMLLPGLSEERKDSWEKAARDFARLCSRNGLDVIAPKPGDPILPGLHRVDRVVDGKAEEVMNCLEWGYRRGARVLRPAVVEGGPLASKVG